MARRAFAGLDPREMRGVDAGAGAYRADAQATFETAAVELVRQCPAGAVCNGSEHLMDMVYAQPGWWRTNISDPAEKAIKCERICNTNRQ